MVTERHCSLTEIRERYRESGPSLSDSNTLLIELIEAAIPVLTPVVKQHPRVLKGREPADIVRQMFGDKWKRIMEYVYSEPEEGKNDNFGSLLSKTMERWLIDKERRMSKRPIVSLNALVRRGKDGMSVVDLEGTETPPPPLDTQFYINRVEKLKIDPDRLAMLLEYLNGARYEDIAQEHGIGRTTVTSSLYRVRRQLEWALGKDIPPAELNEVLTCLADQLNIPYGARGEVIGTSGPTR